MSYAANETFDMKAEEAGEAVVVRESNGDAHLDGVKDEDADIGGRSALLERFINLPSAVNFEFCFQSAWETLAVVFQFSLLNGGPASLVYGAILAGFGGTAVALSLAEMASIDPIVGAQYRWSASFAPYAPRFWGLIQGWVTIAAWFFGSATGPAEMSNFIIGLIIFNKPDYTPQRWHASMMMWAFIIGPVIFNLYFRKVLSTLETVGAIIHVGFFIILIITLPTLARLSTNDFVWKTVTTNESGWKNPGAAFSIGLLSVVFPLAGADAVLHMSAEIKRVRTRAPLSIIIATVSNAFMQFFFAICLMYTVGDLDKVTNSPTGLPIIEVFYLATNSVAATNIFTIAIALVLLVALFNGYASVSRLTWAFAQDNGLPFSNIFKKVHPKFNMPLNALALMGVVIFLLSLIYIGSSTAFNAIVSLAGLALHVSYILPILFILMRKIRGPPIKFGPFKLGRWGIPINTFALLYIVYVSMWMPFPTELPVTGSNMNYAGPVLLFVIFCAIADWFLSGHKRFQFPVPRYVPED